MHRDKDLEALENSETPDLNERSEEENLEWLLDHFDRDPLLASPSDIRETQVLDVWVGGKRVFKP